MNLTKYNIYTYKKNNKQILFIHINKLSMLYIKHINFIRNRRYLFIKSLTNV